MLKEISLAEIPLPNQYRIATALTQGPINVIFFNDGRFSSNYETAINNVDVACCANKTCAHGWNHILWVANNFFSLANIANEGVYRNGLFLQPGEFSQKYSDSVSMFSLMEHDLSYGDEEIIWNGTNASNHHILAQEKLQTIKEDWIDKDNQDTQVSLTLLYTFLPLYENAVGIDTKTLLGQLKQAEETQTMTSELLFISLFKLADVLDYYRKKRLEGLEREDGNDFFDFAEDVSTYTIIYDKENIFFKVKLNKISLENWCEGTNKLYPEIWELAHAVSGLLGRSFVIQEAH